MKTLAFFSVHFGSEYLAWAVKALEPVVDEVHVLYAPKPSYGFAVTDAVNPDTEDHLRAQAERFMPRQSKLCWHRIEAHSESEHKNNAYRIGDLRGADVAFVMDADEVWPTESAFMAADYVRSVRGARRWLCDFNHFFITFDWVVRDAFRPVRMIDLRVTNESDAHLPRRVQDPLKIQHFSLVQSLKTQRYKRTCHSHSPELLENCPNWVDDVWCKWQPGFEHPFLHPVMRDFWAPAPTPPEVREWLSVFMPDHPYYPNIDPRQYPIIP